MALIICLIFLLCSHGIYGTIEENGSEFECVDVYKQPAFRLPSLKNHKIQMRPSAEMEKMLAKEFPTKFTKSSFDQLDEGCPEGTVPILKSKNQTTNLHLLDAKFPGQHFATLETANDGSVYQGAFAEISIHSPSAKQNQYSKAQIWIENGPSSIQVGWAVHPRIYGDSLPRLTTYWTGDEYKNGCYNTMCPGFVQTSPLIYPGKVYSDVSIYGGKSASAPIMITMDPSTNHWLLLHDYTKQIGYWPREIVPSMADGVTRVRYGGNTFVSPDGISPPMGDGHFPNSDFTRCAYFIKTKLVLKDFKTIDIDGDKMIKYSENNDCFKLQYFGVGLEDQGAKFAYGGPGGQCGV